MKIELIDYFGNDDMVVNTARVSYSKTSSSYSQEANNKLIKYLAEHSHHSPFFHPKLQFRLEIPIYVERQFVKTEVGREYNSISGRYVDFSDTYTTIKEWRKQSTNSKQGSEGLVENQEACQILEDKVIDLCGDVYKELINLGVAKEQARTILPLNLNTTLIWTGSLYAFIRLCHQRLKPDAQQETREVVQEMLNKVIMLDKFNNSLKAYNLIPESSI